MYTYFLMGAEKIEEKEDKSDMMSTIRWFTLVVGELKEAFFPQHNDFITLCFDTTMVSSSEGSCVTLDTDTTFSNTQMKMQNFNMHMIWKYGKLNFIALFLRAIILI